MFKFISNDSNKDNVTLDYIREFEEKRSISFPDILVNYYTNHNKAKLEGFTFYIHNLEFSVEFIIPLKYGNVCVENILSFKEGVDFIGRVKELKVKGQDFPTMITVEYQVAGNNYVVTESLKLKSEKIKLGFLPIGQKRVPVMGNTAVGSSATVIYNPSNPTEAFITHNVGKTNI